MIAGLIFAYHEAEDRAGELIAVQPFGGMTLIEYQARLLAEAGATQIVVVVSRADAALVGALHRIGRRGLAVDAARNAAEAAQKLHPLARVVMFADGLVTTPSVVERVTGHGGEALLIVPEDSASGAMERIGGQLSWAGIACLDPRRIGEVAQLPADYDLQSSLLRVVSQAGAASVPLPMGAGAGGHGIDYRAAPLEARSRAVLASTVATRTGWFDRFLLAPLARFALPWLAERHVAARDLVLGSIVVGIVALAILLRVNAAVGLLLMMACVIVLAFASTLGALRDDGGWPQIACAASDGLAALAILSLGFVASSGANLSPLTIAIGLVATGALAERATLGRRRRWWGSAAGYLLILLIGTLFDQALAGLIIGGLYALATLAAAIEALRKHA